MEETHRDEHEPLINGLDALPEDSFRIPQPSEDLRRSIFVRTGQAVRSRARRRRVTVLAFAAAAYMGGIATALLLTTTTVLNGGDEKAVVQSPSVEKGKQSEPYHSTIEPGELVRRSEAAPLDERIHLLQEAGDLYLSRQYDVERAFHCYCQALNAMPVSRQKRVELDDSWLLAALKNDRR